MFYNPEIDDPELLKKFKIFKKIGSGTFSIVYKAEYIINKRKCALKIFDKEKIKEYSMKQCFDENVNDELNVAINDVKQEAKIMEVCKSKNIVELYEYFETEKSMIFVLELCDCNLNSYFHKIKDKNMIDNINFIQQILYDLNDAIKILYQKKIMHRDIKLENIFLKFENKEHTKITVKLGDFGVSTFYEIEQKFSDNVGTLYYRAPEILKEETYNYKCDLYSIGVCLYCLVFREFPFKGETDNAILNKMIHCKTKYLKKTHIKSLDELIEGLLEISPEKRISMEEYLNHPFFKEDLNYLKENKNFVEEIKSKENEIKKQEKKNKQIIENKPKKEEEIIIEKIDEIKNLAQGMENIDIMKISNAYAKNIEDLKDKKVKISNIIYYDENIEKHLDDIHKDSDYFERNTPGTFILCTNIFSFNLVMEEIKSHDKIFVFNLIVTGSKFQKVMDNLIENKYEHFFQNICIYCMKVEKYSHLSKKYNKIKGVYNKAKEIVKFIEDVSSDKIKEFPNLKIVSYLDYKDKYHERHENISQFYGNLSKKIYDIYNKKMENYINSKEQKNFRIEKKKISR